MQKIRIEGHNRPPRRTRLTKRLRAQRLKRRLTRVGAHRLKHQTNGRRDRLLDGQVRKQPKPVRSRADQRATGSWSVIGHSTELLQGRIQRRPETFVNCLRGAVQPAGFRWSTKGAFHACKWVARCRYRRPLLQSFFVHV
ncbi:hypothetical protein LINPERPRIM_LOCUS40370 [Linum perenne]